MPACCVTAVVLFRGSPHGQSQLSVFVAILILYTMRLFGLLVVCRYGIGRQS